MGITDHDLFAMEEQLAAISRGGRGSDDWMTAANADSAAALHDLVRESRLRNREGVIARFHEGEVVCFVQAFGHHATQLARRPG